MPNCARIAVRAPTRGPAQPDSCQDFRAARVMWAIERRARVGPDSCHKRRIHHSSRRDDARPRRMRSLSESDTRGTVTQQSCPVPSRQTMAPSYPNTRATLPEPDPDTHSPVPSRQRLCSISARPRHSIILPCANPTHHGPEGARPRHPKVSSRSPSPSRSRAFGAGLLASFMVPRGSYWRRVCLEPPWSAPENYP